jgi:hypothetical protein
MNIDQILRLGKLKTSASRNPAVKGKVNKN